MIERVELTNFTAFKKLDMRISPGVNVLIGPNGTGKTHLLKILYSVLAAHKEDKRVSDKIAAVFLPKDKRIGRLVTRTRGSSAAKVKIYRNDKLLSLSFSNHTKDTVRWNKGWKGESIAKSVYIPVKEMLANAPGFLSLYKAHDIHFEEVYADILYNAYVPPLRGPMGRKRKRLLEMIQKVIEGKIIQKDEQFFLKNREGELEFTLLAEGMRKLGLLWLLIQNGTLLDGSVLFWDQPEANLNPKLFGILISILLELHRLDIQVFLATHDYVILKELDLRKKETDDVAFHSLYHDTETGNIQCHSANRYLDIHPNAIAEAFAGLYDREVKRSLGGPAQ
ncbi:MAG: AAA family ATPase [Deltaproteobacteria bacterium]|nr:AAA family ATPase [Deltaproteobacteria bacterium]